jgi:hypothetical protein
MNARLDSRSRASLRRTGVVLSAVFLASLAGVSAHVVRGLASPNLVTAFVSSPTAGTDAPVRLVWGPQDTGLRVVCFNAANTSASRADRPGWPRITAVGFELPGTLSGFALVAPLNGDWELVEDAEAALPGRGHVSLDFALMAHINPTGRTPGRPDDPLGIPPGQPAVRGSGTRFCVSGPFPDELTTGQATTIEQIINGVVVGFHGVDGTHQGIDAGIWDNPARVVPLFP